jgi:hypothetical protein
MSSAERHGSILESLSQMIYKPKESHESGAFSNQSTTTPVPSLDRKWLLSLTKKICREKQAVPNVLYFVLAGTLTM